MQTFESNLSGGHSADTPAIIQTNISGFVVLLGTVAGRTPGQSVALGSLKLRFLVVDSISDCRG